MVTNGRYLISWGKQCTVFIVHTIANHHKGIITEQIGNIPAIANRQLRIGIHDGSICLHGTLKLQHHNRQSVYIHDTIRNTLLRAFYFQLVHHLKDIPLSILKVYHFYEQIRLRGIFALDGHLLVAVLEVNYLQRNTPFALCLSSFHTSYLQFRLAVEVELDTVFEAIPSECLHRPCLTSLADALQQDGLPVWSLFPSLELIDDVSFYSHILRMKVRFYVIILHLSKLSPAKIVFSHETTKLFRNKKTSIPENMLFFQL